MEKDNFKKYIKIFAIICILFFIYNAISKGFIYTGDSAKLLSTNKYNVEGFGISYLSFKNGNNSYVFSNGIFMYCLVLLVIAMIIYKDTKTRIKLMGTFIACSGLTYLYMAFIYFSLKKIKDFSLIFTKLQLSANSSNFTFIPIVVFVILYVIIMLLIMYKKNKQS